MSNLIIESSSDEDDTYTNSVARLKALKKQRLEKEKLVDVKAIEVTPNGNENVKRVVTRFTRYKGRLRSRNNTRERHSLIDNTECDVEIMSIEQKLDPVPKSSDIECDNTIVLLSDDDACGEDDNYDMNIKVLWRSSRIDCLSMRRYDSFLKIFQHYADLEKVSVDKILMMRRDKIISCTDTPALLKLSVIDILDGGIVDVSMNTLGDNGSKNDDDDICSIKVQTANKKKSLTIPLRRNQKFKALFVNCAQQLDLDEGSLKFYFDGEQIDPTDTPESLDLEEEACIDLHISST